MVTMIVPTYNRPKCIERLINYYREQKLEYRIIIADSSDDAIQDENFKFMKQKKGDLNVIYERFDSDTHPSLKISQVLDVVRSEYVVLCGDDDFIVPGSLKQCSNFLAENPGYSSAQGNILGLAVYKNSKNQKMKNNVKILYRKKTPIECEDPIDRLRKYLENTDSVAYSVHYCSHFKKVFKKVCHMGPNFSEAYINYSSLIRGKRAVLDNLYAVRQALSPALRDRKRIKHKNTYMRWSDCIFQDWFPNDFAKFCSSLTAELTETANGNPEDFEKQIKAIFLAEIIRVINHYHLIDIFDSNTKRESVERLKKISKRLLHGIEVLPDMAKIAIIDRQPVKLAKFIRSRGKDFYGHLKQGRGLDFTLETLLDSRDAFHTDFLPIYKACTQDQLGVWD